MKLRAFLDDMSRRLYGRTLAEAHRDVICIKCAKAVVLGPMARQDVNEYMLSGLCPDCYAELEQSA